MILELNATEIIACAVDKHVKSNAKSNCLSMRISRLHEIARLMEDEMPSLLTDCDMVAIEDCQHEFGSCMKVQTSSINISGVREVSPRMTRYLPAENIYAKLVEKL